jgi:hypothetical protein
VTKLACIFRSATAWFAVALLFSASGFGAPQIIIKPNRSLAFGSEQATLSVGSVLGVRAEIFAESQCVGRVTWIKTFLKSPELGGAIARALHRFGPSPQENLAAKNIKVLIGELPRRDLFQSMYVPAEHHGEESLIYIDCSQASMAYWPATLAHEFTHALLHDNNIPSWLEEGLAQSAELRAGGQNPRDALRKLSVFQGALQAFSTERPFSNQNSYPLALLLTSYLESNFGSNFFVGLSNVDPGDSMAAVVAQLRDLPSVQSHSSRAAQNILTRNGLIRYFAVALTLNSTTYSYYQVPGWPGFQSPPRAAHAGTVIKPGAFLRLPSIGLSQLPEQLERYRIVSWPGSARIFTKSDFEKPLSELVGAENANRVTQDVGLLINTGAEDIRL